MKDREQTVRRYQQLGARGLVTWLNTEFYRAGHGRPWSVTEKGQIRKEKLGGGVVYETVGEAAEILLNLRTLGTAEDATNKRRAPRKKGPGRHKK